jgi:subtilisin family serine protease
MKKTILFFLVTNILLAQTPNKVMQDKMNFKAGELIVKLKDNVDAKVYYAKSGKAMSSFNIGELLGIDDKITSYEVLFHQKSIEASIVNQKKMKALYAAKKSQNPSNGYQPEEPLTLKNIFILKTKQQEENILGLIEQLKEDKNVEYAEPNYIFSINDFEVASDIIYDKDLTPTKNTSTTVPNDPLYSQQTNITQTNIDDVWNEYTTGDGSQIVAILDTGVDYTHPDLAANIWINEAELNGVEGFDDDGNGYIDDIRGWDFINNDNAPLDDNMHGTHVAGIVGAVGGNGIGVAGAAWNVKLMPIKVFQSNGVGNSSTIAEGINYATANGATIQNMSFGSYAESLTLKSALENAYASSFLVAAAGNNKICIGPGLCPDKTPSAPLYPGAYTFVLGVEDGNAMYDNYDQDGPIFSEYPKFLNYEVKAPGSGIMNTVPNGGYRALTGTSMATPLVAGAMALYMQQKPDDSKELIFGNLINTSGQNVDIKAAIDVVPTPLLKVLSADIKDKINDQNNNGFWEPGETLELFPMIKNYWGPTDDVRVGIEFWEFEDTSKAEILESEIAIGSISAYANLQKLDQSLKIKLADNIANNVNIQFKVSVWSGDNQDYLSSKKITIRSTNATILDGYVESDLHLTTGNEYIFSQNVIVTNNSILTIDPGVVVRLAKDIVIDQGSKIYANGNKDNPIEFRPEQNASGWGNITINDNDISQPSEISFSKLYNSNGAINPPNKTPSVLVNDVLIYDSSIARNNRMFGAAYANGVNIIDSYIEAPIYRPGNEGVGYGSDMYYENSSGYLLSSIKVMHLWHSNTDYGYYEGGAPKNSSMLDFYCDNSPSASHDHPIFAAKNSIGNFNAPAVYFGTGLVENIKKITSDFYTSNNARIGKLNFSTVPLTPSDAPHGHVWKVLVNGKDAQDEFDQMDPVGVGSHEFKVYFNREMDTTVNPQISYGVREPYNQKIISEQGTWSTDGKIYTVTHDVNIGAADGINRIRVQGARDLDYFDIPVEDYRFNMLVQSAGSASAGFMASAGLGEITLDWTAPSESDLNDVLGYNMYKYTANEGGTFTDPVKVNETLITNITFKDYDVVRNTQYFYKYKILRTSFEETDYSNAVSSQLLTAALGDSNGDSSVNVMDVVNTVDYILGNNPTPFVDYATDVNNDSAVNVLDVVGIVDMILNPTSGKVVSKTNRTANYYPIAPIGDAIFYWENDELYVESEYEITGLQLAFPKDFQFHYNSALPKFESLQYNQKEYTISMLYSFGNVRIPQGKTKLLTRISSGDADFAIEKAVVGTIKGQQLQAKYENRSVLGIDAPEQGEQTKIFTIGPNPTSGILNIFYYLPEQMDNVRMTAYDLQGKRVWTDDGSKNTPGQNQTEANLTKLPTGVYFLAIDVIRANQLQKREVKRIIIKK